MILVKMNISKLEKIAREISNKEQCLNELGRIHNELQRIHPFSDGNS
jgi:fido (protein-threonine AMPylation protein)